ncbi:MAG TPA: hypothetical protein VGL02_01325 [Streptomyces sp.]
MSTGPEHYREAERLLTELVRDDGSLCFGDGGEAYVAAAQVHATLALAAATALASTGIGEADLGEWSALICAPDDPYEGMTNADVMSAEEIEEYERAGEAYQDALDEARDAALAAADAEQDDAGYEHEYEDGDL